MVRLLLVLLLVAVAARAAHAAVVAAAKWKFEPAMLDGRPDDVIFHFALQFSR